jgi:curved DNA-binding protein CbpA
VPNVENKATLHQIEAAYRKMLILYHPDRRATDEDAWTAQFQILVTIKGTLSNTEERQKYDRQSRIGTRNVERESWTRRRASPPPASPLPAPPTGALREGSRGENERDKGEESRSLFSH